MGESLLSEDKCGEAIRACKEGIESYQFVEGLCAKYAKASGPSKLNLLNKILGFVAKPQEHLFFQWLFYF